MHARWIPAKKPARPHCAPFVPVPRVGFRQRASRTSRSVKRRVVACQHPRPATVGRRTRMPANFRSPGQDTAGSPRSASRTPSSNSCAPQFARWSAIARNGSGGKLRRDIFNASDRIDVSTLAVGKFAQRVVSHTFIPKKIETGIAPSPPSGASTSAPQLRAFFHHCNRLFQRVDGDVRLVLGDNERRRDANRA